MSRFLTILRVMAGVGFLLLWAQHLQAQSWQDRSPAPSDIDGMGHSKLNHGVVGDVTPQLSRERQQASAIEQVVAADPDVIGMDHSKLNHGVLGTLRTTADSIGRRIKVALELDTSTAKIPPLPSWAPPPEIAAKAQIIEHRSVARTRLIWQPPEEIARAKADKVALASVAPPAKIPPLASWAPPAEIAAKAQTVEHRSVARTQLVWQPPEEIAKAKADDASFHAPH